MAEEFTIEQWDQIISKFTQTFDGLGTVLHNAEMASFTSKAPDVETGIAIYADGQFSASMPLHGIDSMGQESNLHQRSHYVAGRICRLHVSDTA